MFQLLKPDGMLTRPVDEIQRLLGLSPKDYQTIYRVMCATRAFYDHCERRETKLNQMALHIGPRGQEAAEVASAYVLEPTDWILYYARSYGTALARGISFRSLFDSFYYYGGPPESVIDDFLFQHRIMLPYTWVGMHLLHTVGVAWAEKLQSSRAVATAYFGDGATAEGDFHSAMEWASVFDVPIIFVCENNQYAISTPARVQNPAPTFADKASAYEIFSEVADGNDALAMCAVMRRAVARARNEHRPTLIEAVTYRDGPHTSAVGEIVPISKEEKAHARDIDPLKRFRLFRCSDAGRILFESAWDEEQDKTLHASLAEEIFVIAEDAYKDFIKIYEARQVQLHASPLPSSHRLRIHRHTPIQGNQFIPETIANAYCRDGVNVGLYDALTQDTRIICIGQDIGQAGGVMRTTSLSGEFVQTYLPHMQDHVIHNFLPLKHLFPERIFDTPLNEPAIVGVALGMSIAGLHPIFEMQFSGFIRSALHHAQEFGRILQRHDNMIRLPGVCRLPFGHGSYIEYHNECEIAEFAQIHGIVIACPSTPQDFYDMMFAATRSDRLVAFFEHLGLYRAPSIRQDIIRRLPMRAIEDFGIRIAREGTDITIASYGRMVHECSAAAEELAEIGISAEVLDLRILAPLDQETLFLSIRKTGRFMVVQEECIHGFGASVVSMVASEENMLEHLYCSRISLLSTPCSFAPPPHFWKFHVPSKHQIINEVRALLKSE